MCILRFSLTVVTHDMSKDHPGSDSRKKNTLQSQTPTADALRELRERVLARPSAGAIKKTAQEVPGLARSTLSRLLAPSTIELVAEAEKHLSP
jgi:hypothetical protein